MTLKVENYQEGNMKQNTVTMKNTNVKYVYLRNADAKNELHFIFSSAYLTEYDLSDVWTYGEGSIICYIDRKNVTMQSDQLGTYQLVTGLCQETDKNNSVSYLSYMYKTYVEKPFISLVLMNKEEDIKVYTLLKLL